MQNKNSYAKLNDGNWGIRVAGSVSPGQAVTVHKKDGSSKVETVDRVIHTGQYGSLCSICKGSARPSPQRNSNSYRGKWTGCSCGSREDEPRASDCRSCRFENEDQ